MKENNVKDIIRKHLMKECREFYDIYAEDEKKAIIWDRETMENGVSYLVDKERKVVMVLIPLCYDIEFKGNMVLVHNNRKQGDGIAFESNDWWREDANQVVELPENTYDMMGKMLYRDFFNK